MWPIPALRSRLATTVVEGRPIPSRVSAGEGVAGARSVMAGGSFRAAVAEHRRRVKRSASVGGWTAGATGRLSADQPSSPMPVESYIRSQLGTLRARSRHAGMNHPHGRRYLSMQELHVVGPRGIRLQCRAKGRDGELDTALNAAVEEAFTEWGRPENCDVEGLRSWRDIQAAFIRSVAEDGEFLARKWRGSRFGPFGYQLQLLDPELLDRRYNVDLPTGRVRMGVEYNEFGRPIAYHLVQAPAMIGGAMALPYGYPGGPHVRVPASQVIHRFLPERVGQRRGIPHMATVLQRMAMFDGMEVAALVAARQGAARPAFVVEGDTQTTATGAEGDEGTEREWEVTPGILQTLEEGSQVQTVDWPYPSDVYGPFQKAMALSMATGLLCSYAGLTGDLQGTSYSSIRSGRLDELDVFRMLQIWESEALNAGVFRDWAEIAVLAGMVELAPGLPVSMDRLTAIERGATWRPRRWEWIDPLKDAQAWALAIKHGWTSVSAVIRERGDDADEVLEELKSDFQRLGIDLSAALAAVYTGAKTGGRAA